MEFELDPNDLSDWQHKQITNQIWKTILSEYRPLDNILTCSLEKVEYFRGQAEMLRYLSQFFEIKNSY